MNSYTSNLGKEVEYEECTDMETPHLSDGMVPGYLVDSEDGNTYLLFAPDMDSLKHMHAYRTIIRSAKEYMSDHMYDPIRKQIRPAFCNDVDEYGDHVVLRKPADEYLGKVFKIV